VTKTDDWSAEYDDGDFRVRMAGGAEDNAWDSFVQSTPGGHIAQSSLWAHVKVGSGYETGRVMVGRGGLIEGGAQFLIRRFRFVGTVAYAAHAPVVAGCEASLYDVTVRAIHKLCRKHRVRYAIVQPPRGGDGIAAYLARSGFDVSPVSVGPTATFIVNLGRSEENLLRGMRRRTREHIRRGLREGVVVREGDRPDLPVFYSLHALSARRHGHSPLAQSYYERMWDLLHPFGYVRVFLAEFEGAPVASHLVLSFGDTASCFRLGWSGTHSALGVNDLLHWHVIRWAKGAGFRFLDLEGINRPLAEMLIKGTPLSEADRRRPSFIELGYGPDAVLLPEPYGFIYDPLVRPFQGVLTRQVRRSSMAQALLERLRDR